MCRKDALTDGEGTGMALSAGMCSTPNDNEGILIVLSEYLHHGKNMTRGKIPE